MAVLQGTGITAPDTEEDSARDSGCSSKIAGGEVYRGVSADLSKYEHTELKADADDCPDDDDLKKNADDCGGRLAC